MLSALFLLLVAAGQPGRAQDSWTARAEAPSRAASGREEPVEANEEGDGDDHCDEPQPPPRPRALIELGPVLTDAAKIRVREARVRIVIDADPWTQVARSVYGGGIHRFTTWSIENRGADTVIGVGFAYRWEEPRTGRAPSGDRLELVEEVAEVSKDGGPASWPACDQLDDVQWVGRTGDAARGWCRWSIHVPAGRTELRFVSRAPFGEHWLMNLDAVRYDFAAERALREPPERVVVSLAAGKGWNRPIIPVAPPGGIQRDGEVTWSIAREDLSVLRVLATWSASLPGTPRIVGTGFTALASNTLPPQGRVRYDARQVLDADLSTVWCEGAPGDGKDEWLEVRTNLQAAALTSCRLDGFFVVPGHSRSQESWIRNGRLRRYRIARCDAPEAGIERAAPVTEAVPASELPRDGAGHIVWLVGPQRAPAPLQATDGCWRVTLLEVVSGKDPDACVGEVIPLIECVK